MSIPSRLVELISERKIVPFVGSGFSAPSHLPSWPTLVKGLIDNVAPEKEELLRDLERETTLMDVAEILDSTSLSKYSLNEYLIERFDDPRVEPNDYHKSLVELDFDTIVTTNWDRLIEKSIEAAQVATNVIYRDSDVCRYDPSKRVQVLKVHGTVADPSSLVFRKSQYESYWQSRPMLHSLTSILSLTRGFLFVGYGFGDPNFLNLLRRLEHSAGRNRREHYAIVYDGQEIESRLRDLGVVLVPAIGFDNKKKNYIESTIRTLSEIRELSIEEASGNLPRAQLINSEIERVIQVSPTKGVLRMRGALGWLSNPEPDSSDPIYGSVERDLEERRMTLLLQEFLEKVPGAKVRCILHLKSKPLLREYASRHVLRRMSEIAKMVDKFPAQIEIAHEDMSSQMNLMIFDDRASLQGFRLPDQSGIERVRLLRNSRPIQRDIALFDESFFTALRLNKAQAAQIGIDITDLGWSNCFVLKLLRDEIDWLKNRLDSTDLKLASAIVFAIQSHSRNGQTREDGITDFAVHPVRVVEHLKTAGIMDVDILAAAALHDVVEDCGVRYAVIDKKYGSRVCKIVEALTQLESESNANYNIRLGRSSSLAQTVKLADRLDNVREMEAFGLSVFGGVTRSVYLDDSREVLAACRSAHTDLSDRLERAIASAAENRTDAVEPTSF